MKFLTIFAFTLSIFGVTPSPVLTEIAVCCPGPSASLADTILIDGKKKCTYNKVETVYAPKAVKLGDSGYQCEDAGWVVVLVPSV